MVWTENKEKLIEGKDDPDYAVSGSLFIRKNHTYSSRPARRRRLRRLALWRSAPHGIAASEAFDGLGRRASVALQRVLIRAVP